MAENPPATQETQVGSLGWEDSLEKGMATHSSVLAWKIPWTDHRVTKSRKQLSNYHASCKDASPGRCRHAPRPCGLNQDRSISGSHGPSFDPWPPCLPPCGRSVLSGVSALCPSVTQTTREGGQPMSSELTCEQTQPHCESLTYSVPNPSSQRRNSTYQLGLVPCS